MPLKLRFQSVKLAAQ
jgi:hypothetical protein